MNTAHTSALPAQPGSTRIAAAPGRGAAPGRRVNDAALRMFHALFALSFALAWISGDSEHWRALHVTLGYTMAGLLGFRIVYGFVGPKPARWSSLASRLAGAPAWWRAAAAGLRSGDLPWRLGSNLLMTAVVAALLLLLVPLALSGYATYAEWGGDWLEDVHEAFANAMLAIVLLHLGLIILLSGLRRQNLALHMLNGRVSAPGPDLVASQRRWLAAAILVAVAGFFAWQWSASPHGLLPSAAHGATSLAAERDDD